MQTLRLVRAAAALIAFASIAQASPSSWARLSGEKLEAQNSSWPFGSTARALLEELHAMSGPVVDEKFTIELSGREAPSLLNPLPAFWPAACELKIELYGVESALFFDLHMGDAHAFYSNEIPVEVLDMTNDSSGFAIKTLFRGHRREDVTTLKIERRGGHEVLVHVREASTARNFSREKTCLFELTR